MDACPPEGELTVWLGTTRNSRKVSGIGVDPRVALPSTAPGGSGYVGIEGEARRVDDPAERAARRRPQWEPFYADPDADQILIEVTPTRLEGLDFARAIVADPRAWEPPSVVFRRGTLRRPRVVVGPCVARSPPFPLFWCSPACRLPPPGA